MSSEKLVLVLEKLGTVLGDRRFWLMASPVLLTLLGLIGMNDARVAQVKELIGPDGAAAAVFFGSFLSTMVAIISAVSLNNSWTKRAPSGLNFKQLVLSEADKKALEDALSYVVNTFYGKSSTTD